MILQRYALHLNKRQKSAAGFEIGNKKYNCDPDAEGKFLHSAIQDLIVDVIQVDIGDASGEVPRATCHIERAS